MIEKRRFGRTGHLSTAAIFGAAALKNVTQSEADRTLEVLLEHGVNHIDTAARYGDAELRIGPWMREHRPDFFLATKTGERTFAAARDGIRRSLATGSGSTRSTSSSSIPSPTPATGRPRWGRAGPSRR